MSKGICYPDSDFSSKCRIQLTSTHSCLIETGTTKALGKAYGPNSRCLMWSATSGGRLYPKPKCQKVICNTNNTLSVIYSPTVTLLCTADFQNVSVKGESYLLNCPNITDFCSEYASRYFNDCNTNGICLVNQTCYCFDGYSGNDC